MFEHRRSTMSQEALEQLQRLRESMLLRAKEGVDFSSLNRALNRTHYAVRPPSQEIDHPRSRLLDLPAELRLQIYYHVADTMIGSSKVEQQGGRSRFRVDWTAKNSPQEPTDSVRDVSNLMAVCRTTRSELLPLFLRAYIVKFPCWDPGFKLQCLYWTDHVSEAFVNNIDMIWLEGVYWRFSIYLGKTTVDPKEDGKATREDCHRYHREEVMTYAEDGIKFVLKVEYARHEQMWQAARAACRCTFDVLKELLTERGESRLGKVELAWLIQEVPLCGSEQLRTLTWTKYGMNSGYPWS